MTDFIGKSFGRYHILEQLGEGGMATVFKAYDTRLETDVAVKVIRTDNLPQNAVERALKRFEREAKALARLTHPNIVSVTDYGEFEGRPYLVMKYLPGGTLKQRMGKPIPWQEAIQLLLPIAEALDYAHGQNMIHRDVKPSNILLTQSGQPMLTDFGIAKVLDLEETLDLTGTSAAVGTPEYMAPEQATAKTADHRADIYALGVVLYEMITGRKPFIADTPLAVLIMHAHDPLPSPKKYVSGLPDDVEKLLLKALVKRPENRYQSMQEMLKGFEKLLGSSRQPEKTKKEKAEKSKAIEEKRARTIFRIEPKVAGTQTARRNSGTQVVFWAMTLVAVIAAISMLALNKRNTPQTFLPTSTWTSEVQIVSVPTITGTAELSKSPTKISTPTKAFTATPTLGIGTTMISHKDEMVMVYVPEGTFTMGNDNGYSHEKPAHKVFLDAYWIDSTEITNGQYAMCVQSGVCGTPIWQGGYSADYFKQAEYSNYPMVRINWADAQSYCEWADKRLPTEAEWEKAARGTDERIYPWGNNPPNCDLANLSKCINPPDFSPVLSLATVGSYPDGISPYGAYDMLGNAWEWVADWFGETYYSQSPERNPTGPSTGQYRILRGGSAYENARVVSRLWTGPKQWGPYYGVRCVTEASN